MKEYFSFIWKDFCSEMYQKLKSRLKKRVALKLNHKLIILFKIFVPKIIIQISYWVNNTESRAWLKAFLSILKFILALGIYSIDPYCATCCSALGSDRVSRLCVKYLLWVSEGIGGYRKWRSIVYVYGFELGIGNWPNMNKCLLYHYRIGYRKY